MKRIAIIGPINYPIPAIKGGAIETLATAIIDQNEIKQDIDITVYTVYDECLCEDTYKYSRIIQIKETFKEKCIMNIYKALRRLSLGKLPYRNNYMMSINKLTKNESFDVVIFETSNYEICQYQKSNNEKVYFHIHADYLTNKSYGMRAITRLCDGYITVSNFIRSQLTQIDGIAAEKVSVLKNAIEVEDSNLQMSKELIIPTRKKLEINEDEKVFIYCSRLSPEKGCLELIKAFKKFQGGVLLIVGGDSFSSNARTNYVNTLYKEAEDTDKKIIFTGYVPHAEVPLYMKLADIAIVPSICNEAASLTMLEFRNAGLPTIATRKGGIPEYCSDETTFFVDYDENFVNRLASAMDKLLHDEELFERLKKNSRVDIEQYGYGRYYESFLEFCNHA